MPTTRRHFFALALGGLALAHRSALAAGAVEQVEVNVPATPINLSPDYYGLVDIRTNNEPLCTVRVVGQTRNASSSNGRSTSLGGWNRRLKFVISLRAKEGSGEYFSTTIEIDLSSTPSVSRPFKINAPGKSGEPAWQGAIEVQLTGTQSSPPLAKITCKFS